MVFGSKIIGAIYDILYGVNATIWGGVEKVAKVGKIVKIGIFEADVVIGTRHALEDFGYNNFVYGSLDIIGIISSAVGLVIGNIPATKYLIYVTGSVTMGYRSVRYYCKKYGIFWGCTVAASQGVKEATKLTIPSAK